MTATQQRIVDWAASLGPIGLKQESLARLETGDFKFSLYHGRQEEAAEDVLTELLIAPHLGENLRAAVMQACDAVANRIWQDLPAVGSGDQHPSREILTRWVNLVDSSKPSEMKPRATGLLQAALEIEKSDPMVLSKLARAARTFKLAPIDLPTWEKLITIPQTAALAFRTIRQIDPDHPRLLQHLKELDRRSKIDAWPIAINALIDEMPNPDQIRKTLLKPAFGEDQLMPGKSDEIKDSLVSSLTSLHQAFAEKSWKTLCKDFQISMDLPSYKNSLKADWRTATSTERLRKELTSQLAQGYYYENFISSRLIESSGKLFEVRGEIDAIHKNLLSVAVDGILPSQKTITSDDKRVGLDARKVEFAKMPPPLDADNIQLDFKKFYLSKRFKKPKLAKNKHNRYHSDPQKRDSYCNFFPNHCRESNTFATSA